MQDRPFGKKQNLIGFGIFGTDFKGYGVGKLVMFETGINGYGYYRDKRYSDLPYGGLLPGFPAFPPFPPSGPFFPGIPGMPLGHPSLDTFRLLQSPAVLPGS